MPETSEGTNPSTPQETLARIHADLKSGTAKTRLDAIQELGQQKFSSPAILRMLEELALNDRSQSVREAARRALDSPTHRYIQGRAANLNRKERQTILSEIANWESQGLIQSDQAEVIRQRYDFDLKPAPPTPKPAIPTPHPEPKPAPVSQTPLTPKPAPKPAAPHPPLAQPRAPRPSLTQTLLSETSIKIALYLGAFFVIAAAAILAAVVETARLPILLGATVIFAGGALFTRARLPQPSFALFVVFSFLLPTDANVLADVLNLSDKANAGYWFGVMAFMAAIWGFGTWFYISRLFSLAAFVALAISASRLAELFNSEPEIYLLLFSLVSLTGLGGVYLLRRWKSSAFSMPLFILVQIAQLGLNVLALIVPLVRIEDWPSAWNLLTAITWLLTASFYVFSDLIFTFVLFPWVAAAALYPVPLIFMMIFDIEALPAIIVTWIWGALIASASEILRRTSADKVRRYVFPLLVISLPVTLTATLIGYTEEITYGFTAILGSAILYAVLQVLKPRVYIWVTSILLGLGAYFSFFALPFMEKLDTPFGYQFLGASLLLLLPDLFLKPDFLTDKTWRWPLRFTGAFLALLNLTLLLPFATDNLGRAAIAYGIYALFFAIYALRYKAPWLGYLATASAAVTVTMSLQHFDLVVWLPALTGLATIYYLVGWTLLKRQAGQWSGMMRISGLVLGGLTALFALVDRQEFGGWYILLTGALFTVEIFIRKNGWLEAGPGVFFPAALVLILQDFDVESMNYYLLGTGLLWLTLDLVFERTFQGKRPLTWPMRGLGALLTVGNTLLLVSGADGTRVAWLCFGSYTLYFLAYAMARKMPLLGYAFTASLALAIWYLLRDLRQDNWLLPMMAPALAYYLVGFVLARGEKLTGWGQMLRFSGLGVASLISFAAMIMTKESGGWYILTTGGLFTIEMFTQKNGYMETGPALFFPGALVMLLYDFDVTEIGYYLLGLSLLWLALDLVFGFTFREKRWLKWLVRITGALAIVSNTLYLLTQDVTRVALICFGIYTLFFLVYALLHKQPLLGYAFTAYLPLTVLYFLQELRQDSWLLPLMAPALVYYLVGFILARKGGLAGWANMLRYSGLGLASLVSLAALVISKESGGWYIILTGLLFAIEMFSWRAAWAEAGLQIFFASGVFLLLQEADFALAYQWLGVSLTLLGTDLTLARTYLENRPLAWGARGLGALVVFVNTINLLSSNNETQISAICFGIYTLFFLTQAILYRQPLIGYAFTSYSLLTIIFTSNTFELTDWPLPVTILAAIYYSMSYFLRRNKSLDNKWTFVFWSSGLGMGFLVTSLAPFQGEPSAAIPVAVTATMIAVEAFTRRNVWLGFPANALYLMAYFILLIELNVDEPQFFSIATAVLGMLMHYLLTRTGSRTGAFVTGMVSQLVLLSTTYIQFLSTERLVFFALLFFQALIVLGYGVVIRSRSLVITPLIFLVLSVLTVLYGLMQGIMAVVLIGCTGLLLLMLGIAAVIMRDRLKQISERFRDWGA